MTGAAAFTRKSGVSLGFDALLVNPGGPTANSVAQQTQAAADALGRRLLVLRASNEREIDTA